MRTKAVVFRLRTKLIANRWSKSLFRVRVLRTSYYIISYISSDVETLWCTVPEREIHIVKKKKHKTTKKYKSNNSRRSSSHFWDSGNDANRSCISKPSTGAINCTFLERSNKRHCADTWVTSGNCLIGFVYIICIFFSFSVSKLYYMHAGSEK